MKIIKYVFFSIIAVTALIYLWSYSYKQDYNVERQVEINKPIGQVFNYVKLLKNQDNYAMWQKQDPETKRIFTGTDGTVGFISRWESNHPDVGVGEQEITKVVPDSKIETELRFEKPFESKSPSYIITEKLTDSTTTVKWGFNGHLNPPLNLLLLKFQGLENQLGKQFEEGLDNLKDILDKAPKETETKVVAK